MFTLSSRRRPGSPEGFATPFHVCITTTRKNGTLYIGVTNDIARRAWEHREKQTKGFTRKYNLTRLVYYEEYPTAEDAIQREKAMKEWQRAWKIKRIEAMNPEWRDLHDDLVF